MDDLDLDCLGNGLCNLCDLLPYPTSHLNSVCVAAEADLQGHRGPPADHETLLEREHIVLHVCQVSEAHDVAAPFRIGAGSNGDLHDGAGVLELLIDLEQGHHGTHVQRSRRNTD